ncbi:MAG: MBL fold metallo-hydrolase [Syntrophomonadaceae bacterium]|nr:MBL fold metallo-hydrolase [Syntrophomonadaceae bacterium]
MKRISDNVRCLGNRHFNFFVVGKTEAAVIECGVTGAVINFRQQWEEMFPKPKIRYLVGMHAHYDHICGIPSLRKLFPGAAVAASAQAQKVMARPRILAGFFQQDARTVEVLLNEGYLSEPVAVPEVERIEVDYLLSDGEVFNLGDGIKLEIIAAPGHSPCSLAAYLAGDQVMFLSDAGGFQISDTEIFPIFFQGYDLYMETIKRLMGYPTAVLGIPHERIWTGEGVRSFYRRALHAAEEAFVHIRGLTEAGVAGEEIREILFTHYYRGNLRIYTQENIRTCIDLLVRRVQECL